MQSGEPFTPISSPKKLLVRGVNWLGDAVMTTPALQRLREHLPDTQITLLTVETVAEIWQHHSAINSLLSFQPRESLWSVARRIRTGAFDAALLLPNSPRAALEAWIAGVPERIGYAAPWRRLLLTREVPRRAESVPMRKRSAREIRTLIAGRTENHSDRRSSLPASAHQLNEYLRLVSALGANPAPLSPKLELTAQEARAAEKILGERAPAAQGFVAPKGGSICLGLNPSAAYGPAKCWPAQRFAAVAREVLRRVQGSFWLVFGRQADWELCESVAQRCGGKVANLAGKTSLRELMSLLRFCRVVLTNDSGPMHVAAALGTSVVVPFGSTSAALTGPGLTGDPHHHVLNAGALCSPCFRRSCPIDLRCMTAITVDSAVDAVLEAIHSHDGPAIAG